MDPKVQERRNWVNRASRARHAIAKYQYSREYEKTHAIALRTVRLNKYKQDKHKVRRRATWRRWYAANREAALATQRNWRLAHKKRVLEKNRLYREANREALRLYARAYYNRNRVKILAKLRRAYVSRRTQAD